MATALLRFCIFKRHRSRMKQPPFIFSNERRYRFKRHLAFWVFWTVFQGLLYAFVPVANPSGYLQRLPQTMLDSVLFLPNHMFLSYSLMYFVIPFYVVKSRYGMTAVLTAILILTAACMSAFISLCVVMPVRTFVLPAAFII